MPNKNKMFSVIAKITLTTLVSKNGYFVVVACIEISIISNTVFFLAASWIEIGIIYI